MHNNKSSIHCFWDPLCRATENTFHKKNNLDIEIESWEKALLETFSNVISSLMQHKNNILLQLSGGLDSTALFLMIEKLRENPQKFSLLHFLDEEVAASDETSHVRNLQQESEAELIFKNWQYSLDLPDHIQWNRPNHCILGATRKNAIFAKSNYFNANEPTIFNGHGGDQLFLSITNPILLLDYLVEQGTSGLFQKLNELCVLNRSPAIPYFKDILKRGYKHFIKKDRIDLFDTYTPTHWFKTKIHTLINPQSFLPPYWKTLLNRKLSPGKVSQILDIYHASATASFDAYQFNEKFPYLTQPMIEVSCTFPTYLTFNTKWSRLHFRRTISNHFKTNHVWRQSKGETSGIFQRFFRKELRIIQELCLDGFIADKYLLNKDILNEDIQRIASGQMDKMWPLIHLISLELFLSRNCYSPG